MNLRRLRRSLWVKTMKAAVVLLAASMLWRVDVAAPPDAQEVRKLARLCEQAAASHGDACRCFDQARLVDQSDGLSGEVKQATVDQMLGFCVELMRR